MMAGNLFLLFTLKNIFKIENQKRPIILFYWHNNTIAHDHWGHKLMEKRTPCEEALFFINLDIKWSLTKAIALDINLRNINDKHRSLLSSLFFISIYWPHCLKSTLITLKQCCLVYLLLLRTGIYLLK